MAPPDFANTILFPSFNDLAPFDEANGVEKEVGERTLIAQIKEDMTITKPTLICVDRENTPFACVFEGFEGNPEGGKRFLKTKGFKKGYTIVLRIISSTSSGGGGGGTSTKGNGYARKIAPKEDSKSGKAFIRVEKGRGDDVEIIPGALEKVVGIVERFAVAEEFLEDIKQDEDEEDVIETDAAGEEKVDLEELERGRCDGCGKTGGGEDGSVGLLKCTGCGVARYCRKECQVKGWTEGGHKADCKVIKGIISVWGR